MDSEAIANVRSLIGGKFSTSISQSLWRDINILEILKPFILEDLEIRWENFADLVGRPIEFISHIASCAHLTLLNFNLTELNSVCSHEISIKVYEYISCETEVLFSAERRFVIALECCTIIEKRLFEISGVADSGILLKDILVDDRLTSMLPVSAVKFLKSLFLPTGINLRNLLWHGFMAPSELDRRYTALLIVLSHTLLSHSDRTRSKNLSKEHGRPEGITVSMEHMTLSADALQKVFLSSIFVLPGRSGLLQAACADYNCQRPVRCLLYLLPLLEHGLRLLFCVYNESPNHILAQPHAYYSTLDGFGQRAKHQLLLDPLLAALNDDDDGAQVSNKLPLVLPAGAYSLLVDLFLTNAGPNLRARICHGGEGITRNISSESLGWWMQQVEAVLAVVVCLCCEFQRVDGEAGDVLIRRIRESAQTEGVSNKHRPPELRCWLEFVEKYTSRFHPHSLLRSAVSQTWQAMRRLLHLLWSVRLEVAFSGSCDVVVTVKRVRSDEEFTFNDRLDRVLSVLGSSSLWPLGTGDSSTKAGSLSVSSTKAVKVSENWLRLLCDSHGGELGEVPHLLLESGWAPFSDPETPPCGAIEALDAVLETATAGLTLLSRPVRGIGVSLKLLQTCTAACDELHADLLKLSDDLARGRAHTAHRRRYLSGLACLAPVTVSLCSLAIAVVAIRIKQHSIPGTCEAGPAWVQATAASADTLEMLNKAAGSFSACIATAVRSDDDGRGDRKSPDRAVAQLVITLESKSADKILRRLASCV